MVTGVESAAAGQSRSETSRAKLADDLDQFMLLLTTQLQNQDPLDPMDANEFTAQLVQFAGVEQQIHTNSNLEKLITQSETTQLSALVSYIGKSTEAAGQEFRLKNGVAEFAYELDEDAESTTVTITNEDGQSVYYTSGEVEAGKHYVVWDGGNMLGYQEPDGVYRVTVVSNDFEGDPIGVTHSVVGEITAIENNAGDATLYMGDIAVPFEKIMTVRKTVYETYTDTVN